MRFDKCLTTLLILALSTGMAQAVSRVVLLEGFTNWSCGPCASWNPQEEVLLQSMTEDTVVAIKYHVSWPGPDDEFYHWNAAENDARTAFYNVSGVPDGYLDGRTTLSSAANTARTQIRQRYAIQAPCAISLAASVENETTIRVNGSIVAIDSAVNHPNDRLFVALLTKSVHYNVAPGGNGERTFHHIFRDMWPSTNGQPVSIALGETQEFTALLNRDAEWPADDLEVVAFIQNTAGGNRYVHQAAKTTVANYWSFNLFASVPQQSIVPVDQPLEHSITLINTGINDDLYHITLDGDLPEDWTYTLEAPGISPDPSAIDVQLASLQSITITVRTNQNNTGGFASYAIHVVSDGNPNYTKTVGFKVMSGLDILLIDNDDGGVNGNVESYFESALNAASGSRVWGRWDQALGSLDESTMFSMPMIIWMTGNSPAGQTLTVAEQSSLEFYLMMGGNLFLTGQGIAWDIRNSSFLSDVLHCTDVTEISSALDVGGAAETEIGGGLDFVIFGGTGANNQERLNSFSPADNYAEVCFNYSGGTSPAGITVEDNYKALLLGFGFEAISTAAARSELMSRAIDWFLGPESADPQLISVADEFSLGQNYPNPFNAETTILYSIPSASHVQLKVFNLVGQEVAKLVDNLHSAGVYEIQWNGMSTAGTQLGSGMYFYNISAGQFSATKKLIIVK